MAAEDLLGNVLIPHNGAGNALVEQGDIQQQPPEFRLGGHLLAVDVHHVGEQLEGVKADANGQGYLGHHAGEAEPALRLRKDKHRVLEKGQQAQVDDAAQHKEGLAFPGTSVFVNALGHGPVHKTHEQQQHNEKGLAPGVKHQGEQNEHRVTGLNPLGQVVDQHLQGEEYAQEYQGGKNHAQTLLLKILKKGRKYPSTRFRAEGLTQLRYS